MSAIKTLLLLICAYHHSLLCEAAVCYVKPTEPHNATCPHDPCYTLDEYVNNSRYFTSNTVFMFLSGNHNLRHNLTVSDVHNLTLRPYVEGGSVVIHSDFRLPISLLFETVSDVVIRGVTCECISITFDSCTNVTLSVLRVVDRRDAAASIRLIDVVGLVNLSKLSLESESEMEQTGIFIKWIVTQSPYIPYTHTQVLLHELSIVGYMYGIYILGYVPKEAIIVLTNSNFNRNWFGANLEISKWNNFSFVIRNTLFNANNVGLFITPHYNAEYYNIALHNVSYIDNAYLAVRFFNVRNATIEDCYFKGTQSGAITVINSVLSLMGNVTFDDNHNYMENGGAISLYGNSFISIPNPNSTYVLFINNTSNGVGGAIYFSYFQDSLIQTSNCRILLEPIPKTKVFNFTSNKAVNGGNAIYGAYLGNDCVTPSGVNLLDLIYNVSSFSPSFHEDSSVISSDPLDLCFCAKNGTLGDCSPPSLSVYPGQVFELFVALLGDLHGLVRYPLYVTVDSGELGNPLQQTQYTSATNCTKLQYSVLSSAGVHDLQLSFSFNPPNTDVLFMTLNDCPLGFALSVKQECACNEKLLISGNVTCNITEQTIQRQGTTWIGALEQNSSSVGVVFSTTCPFDYCYRSSERIKSDYHYLNSDVQCTGNRTGVLCGGCSDNFSLALGSNRCLRGCSNSKLSLTIAFAAAGIALVFFIKVLNLTVSQGTINGLILYANIVGVEFFPSVSNKGLAAFLSVFIAWLNLDLGIETCFFTGMDAYAKAWLQFVFPVYVWIIALFIIALSHYSLRASQLFGNNSVPVLATLNLLSYSKLLRGVISALSVTKIHFLNGSSLSVWERDGNIQYLTGKHIPLFVFALAVLVLLWFPFTLVLVSVQWLQKGTHYRVLRWVAKLKPFFDAFTGPLKDKYRCWVGTLLLVRCILFLIFFLYTANGEGVALLFINVAIAIIFFFLAATGSVYRNVFLTILELSYYLNLIVLVAGTSYALQYSSDKGNNQTIVTTCVGIAFLQFIATVIYHASVHLREPLKKLHVRELLKSLRARFRKEEMLNDEEGINESLRSEYESLEEPPFIEQPSYEPTFQEISNFREPLLAYLSD